MTKAESNYNRGWPVCQEIDSVGDNVKECTRGEGIKLERNHNATQFGMSTRNLKITISSNLESPLCAQHRYLYSSIIYNSSNQIL